MISLPRRCTQDLRRQLADTEEEADLLKRQLDDAHDELDEVKREAAEMRAELADQVDRSGVTEGRSVGLVRREVEKLEQVRLYCLSGVLGPRPADCVQISLAGQ
mgnify:CR=1 FL=1